MGCHLKVRHFKDFYALSIIEYLEKKIEVLVFTLSKILKNQDLNL